VSGPSDGGTIRRVRPEDVPVVLQLVRELAAYEKAEHEALMTSEQLHAALFGEAPALFGHVALSGDGDVAGFALWFLNFSTWRGTHGIYLEDLYVSPGPGAAADAGPGVRRPGLLPAGVVGAGLEHPVDRLLPGDRCAADGRVDGVPDDR
jgi:hypothetical protein